MLRYVAMGDSLSAGIDETPPGTRWVDHLAAHLRARHGDVVYENLAVYGMKSDEVRASQLDAALAGPVDVATLVCGGNDVLKPTRPDVELFAGELDAMFSALRAANPDALLISGRIVDLTLILPFRERSRAKVQAATQAMNTVIDDVCARHGVRVLALDDAPQRAGEGFLAADGYHPSIAGQRAIFDAVVRQLDAEPLLSA